MSEARPAVKSAQADEYRARAAEYDRKAETIAHGNTAIKDYYRSLAQHWRSLALLIEDRREREEAKRKAAR
jgi:hypothetical protein